jgi:hypothetical protein
LVRGDVYFPCRGPEKAVYRNPHQGAAGSKAPESASRYKARSELPFCARYITPDGLGVHDSGDLLRVEGDQDVLFFQQVRNLERDGRPFKIGVHAADVRVDGNGRSAFVPQVDDEFFVVATVAVLASSGEAVSVPVEGPLENPLEMPPFSDKLVEAFFHGTQSLFLALE